MSGRPVLVAITGGSGAVYAVRLLDVLLASGRDVHLAISSAGRAVIKQELGVTVDLERFDPGTLFRWPSSATTRALHERPVWQAAGADTPGELVIRPAGAPAGQVTYYHYKDLMAPMASGSFLSGGMVICPCSGGTLSAIAHATSQNLIQRAADVQLKERRKLILVPRETPLSTIQLENMLRVSQAGAVVLPAMPGWYHGVRSLADLADFVVARICDQLEVPHRLMQRWGEDASDGTAQANQTSEGTL